MLGELYVKKTTLKDSKQKSLNLLKNKAFSADFKLLTLLDQKPISKKDARPINSQPRINVYISPAISKVTMLTEKKLISWQK